MPERFSHRVINNDSLGNHHLYSYSFKESRPIVLAGHLDTLCPADPAFNKLINCGKKLIGPGVNDMKGGNVVLIWSLKVLERLDLLDRIPIMCIFNGDEELGSPTSRGLFTNLRDKASLAFVFECGGPEGTVVTTRKGVSRYRLAVTGKPGHFGNLKGPKVSAIEELANKIIAIESLNIPNGVLAVNVGRVEGGLAANAIAERATMDFEMRYWDEEIGRQAQDSIYALIDSSAVPGCKSSLEIVSHRPAMQPSPTSKRLFEVIVELGSKLGERIVEEKRGGVSDACLLSYSGIPTIDGLGPLGDNDFTPDEYIITETLFCRIELMANLLLKVMETDLVN
jgi:glutamate carboxypeptidase